VRLVIPCFSIINIVVKYRGERQNEVVFAILNQHLGIMASVTLFELGIRTPGGLFLGVMYASGNDFRRFSYTQLSDFRRNFYFDSIE